MSTLLMAAPCLHSPLIFVHDQRGTPPVHPSEKSSKWVWACLGEIEHAQTGLMPDQAGSVSSIQTCVHHQNSYFAKCVSRLKCWKCFKSSKNCKSEPMSVHGDFWNMATCVVILANCVDPVEPHITPLPNKVPTWLLHLHTASPTVTLRVLKPLPWSPNHPRLVSIERKKEGFQVDDCAQRLLMHHRWGQLYWFAFCLPSHSTNTHQSFSRCLHSPGLVSHCSCSSQWFRDCASSHSRKGDLQRKG